tara:strand:- start:9267 stop:9689 length:423 start_codon:yes stop_codon:yes gene_type:complete
MHWSERFVGIPFQWDGYTFKGCSCWGLLRLVQTDVFGRVLPRHDEYALNIRDGKATSAPSGLWGSGVVARAIDVEEADPGDVLHMWGYAGRRRAPIHVGVFTSRGMVLHIEQGTSSIIENVTSRRFAWRPIQAYRLDEAS